MNDPFDTTRWSLVLAAGENRRESRDALEWLCRTYWDPLYAFVRRRGHEVDQAHDLTQAYFAELLDKQFLGQIDPERGKFRAFLLASMKNFLSKQRDRERAEKRRADDPTFQVPLDDAETRYRGEGSADRLDPAALFEKRWAMTVFQRGMSALATEYEAGGKREVYDRLHVFMTGGDARYAEVARELKMSEGAVKVAVHRMRRRLGALLREEVAHTVSTPEQVDDELKHLLRVLSS